MTAIHEPHNEKTLRFAKKSARKLEMIMKTFEVGIRAPSWLRILEIHIHSEKWEDNRINRS
jgi:hypothetical protein